MQLLFGIMDNLLGNANVDFVRRGVNHSVSLRCCSSNLLDPQLSSWAEGLSHRQLNEYYFFKWFGGVSLADVPFHM